MLWKGGRRSTNVSDRRGMGGVGMVGGGIGAIVITLIALFLGINPGDLTQSEAPPATEQTGAGINDEGREFIEVTLGYTEDAWNEIFRQAGQEYPEAKLVLFDGSTSTACGFGQTAMGPFYCPRDATVYIDLAFYRDLRERFGAPGDFAQAYVIAHEVGHHVQNVTGVLERNQQGGSGPESGAVRVELQADCYAGVWGHHTNQKGKLQAGDIEEALNAATAIGDDRLQKQTQGHVVPESFTHGTSEQRMRWFKRGFDSGDIQQCDTFGTRTL
jgi:uncharacterized protein